MLLPLLAVNAIVMMVGALAAWQAPAIFPATPQALAHLAFAVGVMPMILAALAYFVPVLTRGSGGSAWVRALPLPGWLGGLAIVAGFSGILGLDFASHLAVGLAGFAACAMLIWIAQRARRTLGAPHPCLDWYLAAAMFLVLALLAVLAMAFWPQHRAALRQLHLHFNLLGFVGVTAVGTLQVLQPTAAGRADHRAGARLSTDLKFSCAGVLLLSVSAALIVSAGSPPGLRVAAVLGAALFLLAPLRMANYWVATYSDRLGDWHGAPVSLGLACLGLTGLTFAGVGHTLGFLSGRDAVVAFVPAFLLPLVSGALTQLLPVWLRPGMQGDWHLHLRNQLGRWAGLRALLMVSGGLVVAFGWHDGIWLSLAGVALLAGFAAPPALRAMRSSAALKPGGRP